MSIQEKVLNLYRTVVSRFYKCKPDIQINGRAFNSTVLFSLIAFINQRNVLLYGEFGSGKTSICELIASMLSGMPIPAVLTAELRGSPDITEEKIVGFYDLAKLNQGKNRVNWSPFVKFPGSNVVDEINRCPEIKQSLLLEGVRTGTWLYAGNVLSTGQKTLYATINYEGVGGSFNLIPALKDRFAYGLEASYPGVMNALGISLEETDSILREAGFYDYVDEALNILNQPNYSKEDLLEFTEKFKRHLQKREINTLTHKELKKAREEIQEIGLTGEAEKFLSYFISSTNYCMRTGQKRTSVLGNSTGTHGDCPEDCRLYGNACSYVTNCGSRRKEKDLVKASQILAFLFQRPEVEVEFLKVAAPFVLMHRTEFSRNFLDQLKGQKREVPLQLMAAREFINKISQEYKEWDDLAEEIRKINISEYKEKSLSIGVQDISIEEIPHPYGQDYLKSVAARKLSEI